MQGNFFKNKEILNGWKDIMFFENGSTASLSTVVLFSCLVILKLIIEIIYHEFEVLRLRRKLRTMENVVSILHFTCFNMYEVV